MARRHPMSTPQSIFVAALGACLLFAAEAILLELEPPPSVRAPASAAAAAAAAAGALGFGRLAAPGAAVGLADEEDIPVPEAVAKATKCWSFFTPKDEFTGIYAIHIPKTAICSVLTDLREFPGAPEIYSLENCYYHAVALPKKVQWLLTMLREPRAHVLSQYMECASSPTWPYRLVAALKLPAFGEWVQAWADKVANGTANPPELSYLHDDFGCYRPVNFQTQRLTCEDAENYPHADVAIAVQNMQKIEYVGVVEKYQESICLFHTKMVGTLPEYCDCTNQTAWSSFNPTNETHSVARHSIFDYNKNVIEVVDSITRKDRELYQAGLDRLRQELHGVEARFGVKVLCE